MNYAGMIMLDTANGVGLRSTLFVSGCRHHCEGCFNSQAWDFNYGEPYTEEVQNTFLNSIKNHIAGISILGGEPFEPENQETVLNLVKQFKTRYPDKNIWIYTGFLYEDIKDNKILDYIDILVDGPFKIKEKDLTLAFRGSKKSKDH